MATKRGSKNVSLLDMRILAAVVTHNRCALLQRCLEHIEVQTRKPDALLVVNNASTDDTVSMLSDRGTIFVSQENLGSAGGWNRCIQYALDEGFDAVWLMDDDGFPDANALAALEQALSPGAACASSVVVKEDAPAEFVFPFPMLNAKGLPVLFGSFRKLHRIKDLEDFSPGGIYPFAHFFNGALIDVSAVRLVGNVESSFFMSGDEVDYFFRLRAVGKVFSVIEAKHMHPDVSKRPYTPAKVYYYLKNTLILNNRYFDRPGIRHCLAVLAVLIRIAQRNGWIEMFFYIGGRHAPAFYAAISRGLSGKLGRDFNV
jgi:rhamnopyranosyl-N-acetylglucosaminyl-diphospho-decaprenol beta-1,3/1,4-galactofuranosyltransferase